jgi:peptidyl-prolyl cis-trans isomerase SurA
MKGLLGIILSILFFIIAANAKTVDRIVAQVNDEIITLSELKRVMAEYRQELEKRYSGKQLEQAMEQAEKEALDNLITEKLLYQKAIEMGFNANASTQVSAYIQQIIKKNNLKDTSELEEALAQQGITLADFRDQIRRSIITNDLIDTFVRSRITLLTPEIEKYYKDNADQFTTPEEVTLSEIVIPNEGSDAAAQNRANDIYSRLQKGESFSELASQYSKGPTASKGGSIGTYLTSKLNPEIVKAIANLEEGDISKPQKSADGYVIYRIDSHKPPALSPLEDVKDEIRNQLYMKKFTPEYNRYIARLKEEAYIQIFSEIK